MTLFDVGHGRILCSRACCQATGQRTLDTHVIPLRSKLPSRGDPARTRGGTGEGRGLLRRALRGGVGV